MLATAVAMLLTFLLRRLVPSPPLAFFSLAVILVTWYWGFKPGLLTTILSLVIGHYFFITPFQSFQITSLNDGVRLVGFLVTCLAINLLSADLRRSKRQIKQLDWQLLEVTQKSTEQLKLALAAARMGMWNWNLLTRAVDWTPEHEELFGFAPGTFDGKYETFDRCLYPDDRKALKSAVNQAIRERQIFQHEYRIIWPDGSIHWIEGRGQAFYDETGNAVRMTGTVMDVSDRKRAEAALQQANDELERRVKERTAQLSALNERLQLELLERERTQQKLQEQAQLLDLAQDTIMTRDLNAVITFWNQGAQKMYGFPQTEALGKQSHTLLQTQFPQPLAEIEATFLKQGYWEGELIHMNRDGILLVVASRWVLQSDDEGRPIKVLEINNDISDAYRQAMQRKRAEAALRQSEQKFRALFEQAFQLVGLLATDGIVLEANQAALEFVKARREDIFPRPLWEVPGWIASMENQEIAKTAVATASAGQFYRTEVTLQGADGTLATFDFSIKPIEDGAGQVVLLMAEGRDITYQKQIEATLREANRRWRSLLDNVQLLVVSLDRRGNIEYVNPFFLKLTEYTQPEVLSKNWFEHFLPPSQQQPPNAAFHDVLEHNFHTYYQNSILTKSREELLIAWNNTLLQDLEGNIIGTMSIGEDITQRHAVEKMKNEFISIVSHELRTPLTAIWGSLGMLATGALNSHPQRMQRMIEIAAIDTERLVRLVNDILDLERLESGKIKLVKQYCNVATLIEQSVEAMRAIAQKENITLSVSCVPSLVWASRDHIIQILTNLLSNAIKFSPPNSTISLTAEAQDDCVLFQVKDQGRGIPTDKLETIFERFQQVDFSDSRLKGGTGLGLAICRSIITQHGGQIWVDSVLGEGSTFYFTLPVSPEQT